MSAGEVLCACGYMRMLDPAVSCKRGPIIHAVSHCETTCEDCRRLRSLLSEARDALREVTKRAECPDAHNHATIGPHMLAVAAIEAKPVLARLDAELGEASR